MTSSACSRCDHRFPDLADARPDIVEYIANSHLRTCPGSSDEERLQAAQRTAASGTGGTSVPLTVDPCQPLQHIVAAKQSAPRKRKKYTLDSKERRAALEADEWAADVTETSILCRGCEKRIRLDKRSSYYPGLWLKHRDKCKGISNLKKISRLEGKSAINEKLCEKPANGLAGQVMEVGGVTSTRRESFDGTASPREGATRTLSHGRSFSLSPQSPTRPRTSGGGSSAAGPLTNRDRTEVVYSLPEENAVPPLEQHESNHGIRSMMRPPLIVVSFEEIPFPRHVHDEPSTLRRDYIRSPSLTTQGCREEARVRSNKYWSEAPFAEGSTSGFYRYRYTTRRELEFGFKSFSKRGYSSSRSGSGSSSESESDEEM